MKIACRGLFLLLALALAVAAPEAEAWKLDPAMAEACPALAAAVEAANATVNSPEGVDCFVNGPLDNDTDPETFDDDGEGPEVQVRDLSSFGAYGLYDPATPDVVYVDEQLKVDAEAGDAAAQMVLEATIVHETTHWADAQDGTDTAGEEGCAMETWIYGFPKVIENAMVTPVFRPSAAGTLAVQISTAKTMYARGEPIDVFVTVTNRSSGVVTVVNNASLASEFLDVRVVGPDGRVGYFGEKVKSRISASRLTDLSPGNSLAWEVRLNQPADGAARAYSLDRPGRYALAATYHVPDYGAALYGRRLFAGSTTSQELHLNVGATPAVDMAPKKPSAIQ